MKPRKVRVQREPDLARAFGPWGESQSAACGDARHARSACECFRAWRENPHGFANGRD